MADKAIVNIADVPLTERSHGEKFSVRLSRLAPSVGLAGLGCTFYVVPPGKRAFPFHGHHVLDELFYIVSGEGEYRLTDGSYPVKAGDVIGAPAGKGAHQLINTGTEELRYLGISTMGSVDVVDYPDSNKYAVAAGIKNAEFRTASFVTVAKKAPMIDYWDGEDS